MNLQLCSIINRLLPIKGFRYAHARWAEVADEVIEIVIEERKNSSGHCNVYEKKVKSDTVIGYRCDQLGFLFIPRLFSVEKKILTELYEILN